MFKNLIPTNKIEIGTFPFHIKTPHRFIVSLGLAVPGCVVARPYSSSLRKGKDDTVGTVGPTDTVGTTNTASTTPTPSITPYSNSKKPNIGWVNLEVPVQSGTLLTHDLLTSEIERFWRKVVSKMEDGKFLIVIFRVKYRQSGEIATIGQLQQLNKSDKKYYIDYITGYFDTMLERYKDREIGSFVFSYGIRDGKAKSRLIAKGLDVPRQRFNHFKIPITTDPLSYGNLIRYTQFDNTYVVQVSDVSVATIKY